MKRLTMVPFHLSNSSGLHDLRLVSILTTMLATAKTKVTTLDPSRAIRICDDVNVTQSSISVLNLDHHYLN